MRFSSMLTAVGLKNFPRNRLATLLSALMGLAMGTPSAMASTFHTWDTTEVYSNADGTLQFIELREAANVNSQHLLAGKVFTTNANVYTFPNNLLSSATANKRFLMATAGFAILPGAPAPDYIIPDGFINNLGDTLRFRTSTTGTIWDTFTFGSGELPTDGTHSLICTPHAGSSCTSTGTAVNSPTNFAGQTGSVSPVDCPADLDGDLDVDAADLAELLSSWGPCAGCPADFDTDGDVDAADLAELLSAWGPC